MQNVKLGEVLNDTFPVTTKRGAPVTGLVDKDFRKVLYGPDGADLSEQTPVTISELGNGMYRLNFRPDKVGQWSVMVSHPEHCPWGISGIFQVAEAETELDEEVADEVLTPYVILKHWPSEPTPDLMEHWDIKLKNPQGVLYEWSSGDDPFETADGVLGEAGECCGGEKAFELEGEIELQPGSEWNKSKVAAHLGVVQSGQVHFVEEEPGRVIAYLDQLPFRAIQEGDTDEWDITLGVWASMSKVRYDTLMAMTADEYDPTDLPDLTVDDDWRAVTSWLAGIRVGVEVDKTENEARCYLDKIVKEISDRGRATFNLSKMGEQSRAMLAEILWDLYGKEGKGIYEPMTHATLIHDGTKTMKLEQKPWDLNGFYGLVDGKNVIGMVRFEDREEISEEDFEKRKAEHCLTKEKIAEWGWTFPLSGWKVRECVSLEKPKALAAETGWARTDAELPFPNFHAARVKEPGAFEWIKVLSTLPNGIMIYGGPLKTDPRGSTTAQTYRFPENKFTVAEAREWLKEHDIKPILFEPASGGNLAEDDEEIYAELRTLVEHTKDELERAGMFDEDADYGGMLADNVMEIMKVFAKQGHSGFSAAMCRAIFHKLANFETLTPITSDPDEWMDISEICGGEKGKMWQNKRNSALFSEDGGKTWYDVNDKGEDDTDLQGETFRTSEDHGHRHTWKPGSERTSRTNEHSHEVDEANSTALEMNGHTHRLLTEEA